MTVSTPPRARPAARSPGDAGRKATALCDLCTLRPLPEVVISEVDPILKALLQAAHERVRANAALKLADCSWAPREAVRLLAFEPIEIARPVIERSIVLTEEDLLALAELDRERRLAIAKRKSISRPVTAAVASKREHDCLRRLAENPGARFSDQAAPDVLSVARADLALQTALAGRGDLSTGLARALYAIAGAEARRVLLQTCPDLDVGQLDAVIRTPEPEAEPAPRGEEAAAAALTQRLAEIGGLTVVDALRAARNGRADIADHAVARLIGLEAADWRRALRRSPVRVLLMAARAMAMTPDQGASLFRSYAQMGRTHVLSEEALMRACADIYAGFARDEARRALHRLGAEASLH